MTINEKFNGVVGLPLSVSQISTDVSVIEGNPELSFGNIYLGIEIKSDEGAYVNESSVRLPINSLGE